MKFTTCSRYWSGCGVSYESIRMRRSDGGVEQAHKRYW